MVEGVNSNAPFFGIPGDAGCCNKDCKIEASGYNYSEWQCTQNYYNDGGCYYGQVYTSNGSTTYPESTSPPCLDSCPDPGDACKNVATVTGDGTLVY